MGVSGNLWIVVKDVIACDFLSITLPCIKHLLSSPDCVAFDRGMLDVMAFSVFSEPEVIRLT